MIGDTLMVNDQPLTIIGVAPEGFSGTMRGWGPLIFVPLTLRWLMQPEEPRNDENPSSILVESVRAARTQALRAEQAEAELNGLYRGILRDVEGPNLVGLTDQQKAQYLEGSIVLDPGARGQVYTQVQASNPLTLTFGATVFVLLIACVNIANLLLARGASRAGEMAIRASIGASRWRLVSQLLAEATVLAVIGGALAVPVAVATLRAISLMVPGDIAGQFVASLSPSVMMFAAGMTLATVLLFGLIPALSTGRADPGSVIKAQSAQSAGGHGLTRFRSALVALQVSLSLVLLVLAGLFTKSLVNVARIDFGINVDSLVAFSVTPLLGGYSGERLDAFFDRVREEIAAQPGVESVASVAFPLLYDIVSGAGVTIVGADEQPEDNFAQANPMVSPGFFETTSIPLLAGRDFTDADSTPEPTVAIVNESFVRKFNLGSDAVGTTLRFTGRYIPQGAVEIIGVVADARYSQIKGVVLPQVFTPRPPLDTQFVALFFYVRAALDAETLEAMIPEVVERIDPNVPVSNLTTVRRYVDNNTVFDRLMSLLSATFASLATVLAAVGLYAVLAFNVTQRKRELGLRLALGADPKDLRTLVLTQVGRVAAIGGAIGLLGALALGRLAQALLFGVSGYDPFVLATAVGVLAIVVLAASWLPAQPSLERRADGGAEVRMMPMGLVQDLRSGARLLARNPGFTLIAVISLAVGIGANTATFSFADALLLRPLPVSQPNEVVTVGSMNVATGGTDLLRASYRDYVDLRDASASFAGGLVAFEDIAVQFLAAPEVTPEIRTATLVSGNFFSVMGVQPTLGRAFFPGEDEVPGRDAVAVLSYRFWERELAADPEVLGRRVRLNGIELTVIGVAPERFIGVDLFVRPDLYVPMMMWPALVGGDQPSPLEQRDRRVLELKGRLRDGVTLEQARADVARIGVALAQEYPATNRSYETRMRTELQNRFSENDFLLTAIALLMVLGAVVLLVACVNVAGLLTSRAPTRESEIAVRLSIGAGRARIVRQLLTESALLALCGALAGVAVGYLGIQLWKQIPMEDDLTIELLFQMDRRVLSVNLAVAMASVFVFGLMPALRASRASLTGVLRTTGSGRAARAGWGRGTLVVVQVALSVVFIAITAFIYASFLRELRRRPRHADRRCVDHELQHRAFALQLGRGAAILRTARRPRARGRRHRGGVDRVVHPHVGTFGGSNTHRARGARVSSRDRQRDGLDELRGRRFLRAHGDSRHSGTWVRHDRYGGSTACRRRQPDACGSILAGSESCRATLPCERR